MSDEFDRHQDQFPSTRWSLIDQARDDDSYNRRAGLDQLLRRYWPALRTHLVCKYRIDHNQVDDILQGFIVDKILEKKLLDKVDQEKGRFRSLLLRSLTNYFIDQIRRDRAHLREIDLDVSSQPDAGTAGTMLVAHESDVFDAVWARRVLDDALGRMRKECHDHNRTHIWKVFKYRIFDPLVNNTAPISYNELVAQLNFDTPEQASNALITAKRQFHRILHTVVGEYVETEQDIQEEISSLHDALVAAGRLGLEIDFDQPTADGDADGEVRRWLDIEEVDLSDLARMLTLDVDRDATWCEDDLAALLNHQLSLPLKLLLEDVPREYSEKLSTSLAAVRPTIVSLRDLFLHEVPPVEVLRTVKESSQRKSRPGGAAVSTSIFSTLYFSSIAVALLRHDQRITGSSDEVLQYGFNWLLDRTWIDEEMRQLFHDARSRLVADELNDSD